MERRALFPEDLGDSTLEVMGPTSREGHVLAQDMLLLIFEPRSEGLFNCHTRFVMPKSG